MTTTTFTTSRYTLQRGHEVVTVTVGALRYGRWLVRLDSTGGDTESQVALSQGNAEVLARRMVSGLRARGYEER